MLPTVAGIPGDVERFDPESLQGLPAPAQRLLARALPPGTPLVDGVALEMRGEIRLGRRWFPFEAHQVLAAGVGFRWQPVVGGRLLRVTGADELGPDVARVEFRLHGLVPVARSTGPDVARSAAGRLAAETVVWLPQALVPQLGARWTAVDHDRARVLLHVGGEAVPVTVTVGGDGQLLAVALPRWNGGAAPPAAEPFGGSLDGGFTTEAGVRIAGSGTVGWGWGTPAWPEGAFFRFSVTGARHLPGTALDLTTSSTPAHRSSIRDLVASAGAVGRIATELVTTPVRRAQRLRWGATPGEAARALPGDDVVPEPRWQYTRGITIDAPASAVWPWLAQIGQGRAGFYSYTALENLFGCKIRPMARIDPDLQQLAVGDQVRMHPRAPGLPVVDVSPGHHLVLGGMASATAGQVWAFHLVARTDGSTRLLIRGRGTFGRRLVERLFFGPALMEPITFVMERKMLRTIKRLAESDRPRAGRAESPPTTPHDRSW